ncbi:pyridoxal-phosphate dependent enzyme [Mesorhizobium sp. M00.F.Ca.ET.151.01.1.1]|nr:pyridoxal-phosphate dependent enzyme [Mesorhizobium sp. M00.F.Ca.ET.151.01.1.1]
MSHVSRANLEGALALLPRARLAHLPTPLDFCPRLTEALGGPKIWFKRDDCTGLAFGGNKVRQHEYILGDALSRGVDVVVQGAASQSNQSRQLAAAAARLGLECILMPRKDAHFEHVQGNQLIVRRFGAKVIPIEANTSTKQAKQDMAARLEAGGRRPMILGMGAERALTLAAVAYVGAYLELWGQLEALDEPMPTHLYVTSQVSTQAGLQAAAELLGHNVKICGINPMDARNEAYETPEEIAARCRAAAELLGFRLAIGSERINNSTDFVGEDYGTPAAAAQEAADLLARTEGILVDPVYSGKGFSGLVSDIKAGVLRKSDRVVFLHTGGLPAIFSYSSQYPL